MPDYSVFRGGRYVKSLTMPDLSQAKLNAEPGDIIVDGWLGDNFYLKNGVVSEMPPQPPGGHWVFDTDTHQWIDPRTPADHQAALYAARTARDLSFREFLFACNDHGILSDEDMIEAANRQIPSSFADAMAALDPKLQMQIRVTWASLTTVNRMDPLLLLVAHAKDIPPELLDALFGVVLPT